MSEFTFVLGQKHKRALVKARDELRREEHKKIIAAPKKSIIGTIEEQIEGREATEKEHDNDE